MRGPPSSSILLPTNQRRASNIRQRRDLTIAQASIDMLALTCPHASQQRRHDRVRCIQPCRQIRNRYTNLHRIPIPGPSDMHQAHLRLDHDIVPSPVTVRARLAVSGDTRVDQLGVNLPQGFVVHIIFLQTSGEVVLDENVAFFRKAVQDLHARLVLKRQS